MPHAGLSLNEACSIIRSLVHLPNDFWLFTTLVHYNQHTAQLKTFIEPTKHLQTKAFTNISYGLLFDNRISEDMLRFTEDLPAHLNPIHNTF